ncbi:MAG: tail fiber domain-containing protein, partial [Proteobacteria bacterium]|nr:tail fiber domain-containing protein [Pseudomonadota bacterium]
MKKRLIITAIFLMGFSTLALSQSNVVVVPLNTNRVAGTDGQLQYNDNGKNGGAEVYYDDSSAYVGIGTAAPAETLHVIGGQIRIDSTASSATSNGGIELRRSSNLSNTNMPIFDIHNLDGTLKANMFYGYNSDRLYVTNNGFNNLTGVYLAYGGTAWTTTSDERLKEDIQDVSYGLSEILALRPRDFTWKENGMADTGFIAQEVYGVFPQAVEATANNEVGWGVNYSKLTPL